MELISFRRKEKNVRFEYDKHDAIIEKSHDGMCPICLENIIWTATCDQWTEDDNGVMQPDYNAYSAECHWCELVFVDPYGDGLIRMFDYGEDDTDYE